MSETIWVGVSRPAENTDIAKQLLPPIPPYCANCRKEIYQQGCPEDGGAVWKHEFNRSIQCEHYAEPDDGRYFEVTPDRMRQWK